MNSKILIGIIAVIAFIGCSKTLPKTKKNNISKIENNYKEEWKSIETLEKKGAAKSIIEATEEILIKAKAEANYHQIFKALAYRSKYINQIEEDAHFIILNDFVNEAEHAQFPLNRILHSATAELFSQYLNANRWKFQNRTTLASNNDSDFRNWSLEKLHQTINKHYHLSIQEKEFSEQFPLDYLDEILIQIKDNNSHLHDNLYDLLAFRALNHFKSSPLVNEGISSFEIDDYPVFSNRMDFVKIQTNHKDSTDHKYNTFNLFQNILSQDLNDTKLVSYDLDRLKHYHIVSHLDNKSNLYEKALLNLKMKFPENHEITHDLAQLYLNSSSGEGKSWSTLDAFELLNDADLSKNDFGTIEAKQLLESITEPQLSFQLEHTMLPNIEYPFLIQFKNLDQFYFRVIDVSPYKSKLKSLKDQEAVLQFLIDRETKYEWHKSVEYSEDYEQHTTELLLPKLDVGQYFIIVSNDSLFKYNRSQIAYSPFQISQLSKLDRNHKNKHEIFVLNRGNGKAVENATIEVYEYNYGWQENKRIYKKITTDKTGYASFPVTNRSRYQYLIYKDKDTLEEGYTYFYQQPKPQKRRLFQLFTDRAIYRPGQTVYFKGILYDFVNNSGNTIENEEVSIQLFDVNLQKISSQNLKTNAYGSVDGAFTLPNSGLNGMYRIQTAHGSVSFSVEEYKRPTFEIELDSIQKTIQLNDSVTVNGIVKGFAGNKISQAKIKYRIVRNNGYPAWYFKYCSYFPFYQTSKEIAQGETTSHSDGSIQINFKATAPATSGDYQFYNYDIKVSATSANGETQETSYSLPISNKPIVIGTNLNRKEVFISDFKKLEVITKTLSNKNFNTKVELSLYKLKTASTYSVDRLWSEPDLWSLKKSKYNEIHLSYQNNIEDRIDYLVTTSLVRSNKKLNIFNDIQEGEYLLRLKYKSDKGKVYSYEQHYELRKAENGKSSIPHFFKLTRLNDDLKVGDTAKVLLSSSLKHLPLQFEIEHKGSIVKRQSITLKNEQKVLKIPIDNSFRGGFHLHVNGLHSNRSINEIIDYEVPFDNKKLNLKLQTFRDKMEPGATEKWTINISDYQNRKLNGELLLAMYDASLDQIKKHEWSWVPYSQSYSALGWQVDRFFAMHSRRIYKRDHKAKPQRVEAQLNWFGLALHQSYRAFYSKGNMEPMMLDEVANGVGEAEIKQSALNKEIEDEDMAMIAPPPAYSEEKNAKSFIRKNFNETAFFYPKLISKDGSSTFEFKVPDVFTEWKFMALAHTKDLSIGNFSESMVSQKEIMVFPNAPRFFREGDKMKFSALVSNMTDSAISSIVSLQFFDPLNGKAVKMIQDVQTSKNISILANGNTECHWDIEIPNGFSLLSYRITASTSKHTDGEEKTIPVLLNRKLLTEALPISLRGGEKKEYHWERLALSSNQKTLEHKSLTLEYTPNPVWYAIQSLPYLAEANSECTEQQFSRLFANSIAENIVQQNPRIKLVFEAWKSQSADALLSNLEKNQELKSTLINNTPWLNEAKSESEQKRRIGLLFDYNQMATQKASALNKLKELQYNDGSWPWYKGMKGNRYITQYIIEGLGKMHKIGILDDTKMIENAINYLDQKYLDDYYRLKKNGYTVDKNYLSSQSVHYLFARSYFSEIPLPKDRNAFDFYLAQASDHWVKQNNYLKGMIALALHRLKPKSDVPAQIIYSLKEHALLTEEQGMYWKSAGNNGYWHESNLASQALLIEAFQEIGNHTNEVDEMKIWLLKQKQTQSWSNSKSTTLACYALIEKGSSLLNEEGNFSISVGKELISSNNVSTEAGTNYFKKQWTNKEIDASKADIKLINNNQSIAWGALYWQYYQDLDQITSSNNPSLNIDKSLYKVELSKKGEILQPIDESSIQKGDLIKVRIKIFTDRNLEFVQLKDMRSSLFEPTEVLSTYQFQDGLGYYQNVKDASTEYYFDYLPKGQYVFESTLKANVSGNASNGIASIQCYYAPEFVSHSSGKRIVVK